MFRRRLLLSLCCFLLISSFAWQAQAGELAGGGVFIDLPGCLISSPCAATVSVFPQLRLTLGSGLIAAHLDILNVFTTFSALWIPYVVLQFPLTVSDTVTITPYIGLAPVLATVGVPAGSVDWMLKFGDTVSIQGFGFFAEILLPVPFAAVPSLSFGALAEF